MSLSKSMPLLSLLTRISSDKPNPRVRGLRSAKEEQSQRPEQQEITTVPRMASVSGFRSLPPEQYGASVRRWTDGSNRRCEKTVCCHDVDKFASQFPHTLRLQGLMRASGGSQSAHFKVHFGCRCRQRQHRPVGRLGPAPGEGWSPIGNCVQPFAGCYRQNRTHAHSAAARHTAPAGGPTAGAE
jgi:hypothetical protein